MSEEELKAELERLKGGTPFEEIALLNEKLKDAEERGAREMAEIAVVTDERIVSPEEDAIAIERLMALWREGKK